MQTAFQIKSLDMGYAEDAIALRVSTLDIKRGQLSFVTGPSGAGKSTLLESLGLMKNTLLTGPQAQLTFSNLAGKNYELKDTWQDGGDLATQIRSHYFSFIFQYTNLMPNFTLGENICFTGMLEGKSMNEVKPRALELMSKLNLDHSLFDQPATMASGGQRQRAAFVRALCKDYEVLFGDEPTGNLDKENAISLFETLKHEVKSKNRTAIIVSHDLELSERFADEIIDIKMAPSSGATPMGLIS